MKKLTLILTFLAATLALSGCAYVIAPQWRQAATRGLTFAQVLADPEAHKGAVVIWGGTILETENTREATSLVLLETPVDRYGYPRDKGYSPGRFIARTADYLDPAVYRSGRQVTLAGEVSGKETRPLGQTQYTYPVVTIRQLYLWSRDPYAYYYPYGYYPWDYWDYYWGPFYPFYFEGGIIIHGRPHFEGHRERGEHREERRHR